MAEVVVMPKLGLTMVEGSLIAWLAEVGQGVTAGSPLFEVETEKLTIEVESPATGTLLRRIEPTSDIPVGAPIAVIGEPHEDPAGIGLHGDVALPDTGIPREHPPPAPTEGARAEEVETATRPSSPGAAAPVSPVARRLAAELGIDIATVQGTGPGGRVTKRDVEEAAAGRP